jgi:hypothetical protein
MRESRLSKVYLCSFASPDLKLSVNRFIKQSHELKFYDEIKVFDWKDLSFEKQKQMQSIFNKGQKRLYGYGSWKAEIILTYLETIPKNSILQYSDIGCVFNPNGREKLKEYIQITDKENLLAFKYSDPKFNIKDKYKFQIYYENQYTKADAWKYFNIDDNSDFLKTEQVWSGTMFFKNNIFTKKILNNWKKALNETNLIDDSPSVKQNHPNFIEHRHDQSMLSLICKKENIFCLSASECEWAEFENKRMWSHLKDYPILAKRDKKFNIIKRFINRQKKNIARFLKKRRDGRAV